MATILRFRKSLQHQVLLLLVPEQDRAVAAADRLELVRDVLAANGDVIEDAPERQVGRYAGGARGLQRQRAPDRRRLRAEWLRQLRQDLVLEDADRQVQDAGYLRPLLPLGERLRRDRRGTMS